MAQIFFLIKRYLQDKIEVKKGPNSKITNWALVVAQLVEQSLGSDTRGLRFESSHWQILNIFSVNCIETTKINKKRLGMAHLKKNKRPNNKCKYISTSDQTNKAADFTDDYDVDDDDVWLPLIEFKIEDKIELRNSANSSLPTMTMMMMM